MIKNILILICFHLSMVAAAGEIHVPPVDPTPDDETLMPDTPEPVLPILCHTKFLSISLVASVNMLALCESGKAVKTYRVALGSGGVDKRKEGDRKTPLGVYKLGTPKTSDRFGTFIPVGYPTKAQKAGGYTGAAVGIHGPDKDFETLGDITVMINWTAGCIALGYYTEINEIKDWVNTKHPQFIQILP